jgi:hypothetical protein
VQAIPEAALEGFAKGDDIVLPQRRLNHDDEWRGVGGCGNK